MRDYLTLLSKRVESNLAAKMVDFRLKRRPEWDGGECSIIYDFVALWRKEDRPGGREWGYHSGVIWHKKELPVSADVFWGHYDLDEANAREGYLEKRL